MNLTVRDHMLDGLRRRNRATLAAIARRSALVTVSKKLLPLAAVALLVALGLAPSWHAGGGKDRVTYHISNAQTDNASRMQGARYHGVDQQGSPLRSPPAMPSSKGPITSPSPSRSAISP